MKNITRLATILLIIFVLGSSTSLSVQAQPDITQPYLYYYSQLLGGLIIEHPDGTDTRQIAADVIPPNLSGLIGPAWSPSGKYFVAFAKDPVQTGIGNRTAYAIDSNGQKVVLSLYEVATKYFFTEWSLTGEDILLVVGNHVQNNSIELGTFFWLIDFEHNGKLLAEFATSYDIGIFDLSTINWDIANQKVQFYLAANAYDFGSHYRITMHFDGTTLREPVALEAFIPRNFESNNHVSESYSVSPQGTYEAHGYHPSLLTDIRTNQTIELPNHSQGKSCRSYLWTEDEKYMITLDGTLVAGHGCGDPVLGVTNSQGSLWRELGNCSWVAPPCAGWLPQNIELAPK